MYFICQLIIFLLAKILFLFFYVIKFTKTLKQQTHVEIRHVDDRKRKKTCVFKFFIDLKKTNNLLILEKGKQKLVKRIGEKIW